MPLADVAAAQEGAWRPLGVIEARAAFDAKGAPWIVLRQGGRAVAHALTDFDGGVVEEFPAGRTRTVLKNGVLQGPRGDISVQDLVQALFESAKHQAFPPVDYALALEHGGLVPASVSLIRRDADGNFFVSYHSPSELAKIDWILGVNGTLYGVKLEGAALVFYSEPAPAVKAK
jgi:hypothetical protein